MRVKFVSLFVLLFIFLVSFTSAGNFISTWNTSATSSGSSNSTTIDLPLESSGDYDFTVYWGDGNVSNVTAWDDADRNHTYGVSGIYEINITGKIHGFRFNNGGDKLKLINITSWGGLRLGNSGDYFYGASNLKNITGAVNLSGTTDMSYMFASASLFNQDVGGWDVSGVTEMDFMFSYATAFNQDVGGWDVKKVSNMASMFSYATAFNQDLSGWRVCGFNSKPFQFDSNAGAWSSGNKPKWLHPCVVLVNSTNADGLYGVGDEINVTVQFNEAVNVSGVPKLELMFDGGSKNATYVSGDGTATLTFNYTVGGGG